MPTHLMEERVSGDFRPIYQHCDAIICNSQGKMTEPSLIMQKNSYCLILMIPQELFLKELNFSCYSCIFIFYALLVIIYAINDIITLEHSDWLTKLVILI